MIYYLPFIEVYSGLIPRQKLIYLGWKNGWSPPNVWSLGLFRLLALPQKKCCSMYEKQVPSCQASFPTCDQGWSILSPYSHIKSHMTVEGHGSFNWKIDPTNPGAKLVGVTMMKAKMLNDADLCRTGRVNQCNASGNSFSPLLEVEKPDDLLQIIVSCILVQIQLINTSAYARPCMLWVIQTLYLQGCLAWAKQMRQVGSGIWDASCPPYPALHCFPKSSLCR